MIIGSASNKDGSASLTALTEGRQVVVRVLSADSAPVTLKFDRANAVQVAGWLSEGAAKLPPPT